MWVVILPLLTKVERKADLLWARQTQSGGMRCHSHHWSQRLLHQESRPPLVPFGEDPDHHYHQNKGAKDQTNPTLAVVMELL
ncbi:unnamed protein product [Linum trigynum]|uniref:Secreted protein n=1 Tax=Linum trigynum TaxID=586398 RepID=A0AAV2F4I1_9ROSI